MKDKQEYKESVPGRRVTGKRIYIAGPMSGYPNRNKQAFNSAADHFRGLGHTVINPAELDDAEDLDTHPWEYYLRRDLGEMLAKCDTIALLPEWIESRGARLEFKVAAELGFEVVLVSEEETDA